MDLNKTYQEKVYAGVLGKVIGVYLGRPFEGWTYERIMAVSYTHLTLPTTVIV